MTYRGVSYTVNATFSNEDLSQIFNASGIGSTGKTNVTISFGPMKTAYKVPLAFYGSLCSPKVYEGTGCISSAYCCVTSTNAPKYYLVEPDNTTVCYDIFTTSPPVLVWSYRIYFSTERFSWSQEINQDSLTAILAPGSLKRSEGNTVNFFEISSQLGDYFPIRRTSSDFYDSGQSALLNLTSIPMMTTDFGSALSLSGGEFLAIDPSLATPPFVCSSSMVERASPSYASTFASLMQGKCDLSSAQNLLSVDTFDAYTGHLITSSSLWISSINASKINPSNAPNNELQILALDTTTITSNVDLKSTSYTLQTISALPAVLDASSFILTSKTLAVASDSSYVAETLNFYVNMRNDADFAGFVLLKPWRCCFVAVDSQNEVLSTNSASASTSCASWFVASNVITIGAHQMERFYFQLLQSVPYGYSGYCSFNVSTSQALYSATLDIGFAIPAKGGNTQNSTASTLDYTSSTSSYYVSKTLRLDNGTSTVCALPYARINEFPYCKLLCAMDQVLLTSNGSCVAVDCVLKYKGTRDLYDATQGLCKASAANLASPAPSAAPTPAPVPVTPSDTPVNVTAPAEVTISPAFGYQPDGTFNIDCGPHGTLNSEGLGCNCASGWATGLEQDLATAQFCSVQLPVSIPGPKFHSRIHFSVPRGPIIAAFAAIIVTASIAFHIGKAIRHSRLSKSDPNSKTASSDGTPSQSSSSTNDDRSLAPEVTDPLMASSSTPTVQDGASVPLDKSQPGTPVKTRRDRSGKPRFEAWQGDSD